jgi:hypothetical protein
MASGASKGEPRFGTTLVLPEEGKASWLEVGLGVPRDDEREKTRFAAADVAADSELDVRWRDERFGAM